MIHVAQSTLYSVKVCVNYALCVCALTYTNTIHLPRVMYPSWWYILPLDVHTFPIVFNTPHNRQAQQKIK